jgi:hypothetical protein
MKGSLVLFVALLAGLAQSQTLLGNIDQTSSQDLLAVNYLAHPVSGGMITVGQMNLDLMVNRYDMFGNLITQVRYDSPQASEDEVVDSAMDSAGNLYVLLRTTDNRTKSMYVVKFNSNLVLQFERRISDVSFSGRGYLACSPTGSFYVLYPRVNPQNQQFVQAWASNGNALWTYTLPVNEQWNVRSFEFDSNNSTVVAVGSTDSDTEARVRGIRVTDGALLYSTVVSGDSNTRYDAIQPFTGATYLVGSRVIGGTNEIRVVRRTTALGQIFTAPALSAFESVQNLGYRDSSFAYFATNRRLLRVSFATNTMTFSPDLGFEIDQLVVSPNTDMVGVITGETPPRTQWYRKSDFVNVRTGPFPANTDVQGIRYLPDSGDTFMAYGTYSQSGSFLGAKAALVGYQSDGDQNFFDAQGFESPITLGVNVLTTDNQGFLYTIQGLAYFASELVKFNSNGSKIWTVQIPDFEVAAGIAAIGDALYVSSITFGNQNNQPKLRKYRQSDGALLWTRNDFAPLGADSTYAARIYSAPNGNIVLGGSSNFTRDGSNPFVAVINPDTGTLIWRRILGNAPSTSISDFNISANGNIYAVGAGWAGHSVMAYSPTGATLFSGYTSGGLESTYSAGTHLLANSWLTARVVNDASNTFLQVRELNLTTGSIIRQMNRTLMKGNTSSAMLPIANSTKLLFYYIEGTAGKLARWNYATNTVEWTVNTPTITTPKMVYDAAGNVLLHGPETVTDSEGGTQTQATLVRLSPTTGAQLSINRITGLLLYQTSDGIRIAPSLNGRFYTTYTLSRRNVGALFRIQRWVTPVAPVATNNSYTTPRNVTLNVAAPGVLTGDTDANGETLTAELVVGPPANKGTLTLSANGSFTFVPAVNTTGATTFTYRAKDPGGLTSNTATVTINVTP